MEDENATPAHQEDATTPSVSEHPVVQEQVSLPARTVTPQKPSFVTITPAKTNKYGRQGKVPSSQAGKTQMVSIQRMQSARGRKV
jgi:hypothetical protein